MQELRKWGHQPQRQRFIRLDDELEKVLQFFGSLRCFSSFFLALLVRSRCGSWRVTSMPRLNA